MEFYPDPASYKKHINFQLLEETNQDRISTCVTRILISGATLIFTRIQLPKKHIKIQLSEETNPDQIYTSVKRIRIQPPEKKHGSRIGKSMDPEPTSRETLPENVSQSCEYIHPGLVLEDLQVENTLQGLQFPLLDRYIDKGSRKKNKSYFLVPLPPRA